MSRTQHIYARRSNRHRLDSPCEVICSEWDEPFTHSMVDLSSEGVWLRTSFPRKIGETVVLSFRPPHSKSNRELSVFAKVTRVAPTTRVQGKRKTGGMGLTFTDLTHGERKMLRAGLGRLKSRSVQ